MPVNNLRSAALEGIDEFRSRHGLSASAFGRRFASNDHHFLRCLRKGDNVGLATLERVGDRMAAFEAAGGFEADLVDAD